MNNSAIGESWEAVYTIPKETILALREYPAYFSNSFL